MATIHPRPARTLHRIAALILAASTVLATVVFADPAGAAEPDTAPTCKVTSLRAYSLLDARRLGVSFTGCGEDGPQGRPTGYRVDVSTPFASTTPFSLFVAPDQFPNRPLETQATVLPTEITHFTVTPYNAAGDSTASTARIEAIAPHRSIERYVERQLLDGFGLAPADVVADIAATLRTGSETPLDLTVLTLEQGRGAVIVEPIVRLYRAYFLRDPDGSGLIYWVNRRESGEQLGPVSSHFAASSEFKRTYGTLSNAAFVTRIYKNVLGRSPDPEGQRYWRSRLDARRIDRGRLMVQFSESPEYIRKSDPRVEPTAAAFTLIGRRPRGDEWTRWVRPDEPGRNAAAEILGMGDYAGRFRGR